jgi:hypothetical protein
MDEEEGRAPGAIIGALATAFGHVHTVTTGLIEHGEVVNEDGAMDRGDVIMSDGAADVLEFADGLFPDRDFQGHADRALEAINEVAAKVMFVGPVVSVLFQLYLQFRAWRNMPECARALLSRVQAVSSLLDRAVGTERAFEEKDNPFFATLACALRAAQGIVDTASSRSRFSGFFHASSDQADIESASDGIRKAMKDCHFGMLTSNAEKLDKNAEKLDKVTFVLLLLLYCFGRAASLKLA